MTNTITILLVLFCSFQVLLVISSVFTAPHTTARNTNDLGGGGAWNRAECYNKIGTWTLDVICPIGAWYKLFTPCCSCCVFSSFRSGNACCLLNAYLCEMDKLLSSFQIWLHCITSERLHFIMSERLELPLCICKKLFQTS